MVEAGAAGFEHLKIPVFKPVSVKFNLKFAVPVPPVSLLPEP